MLVSFLLISVNLGFVSEPVTIPAPASFLIVTSRARYLAQAAATALDEQLATADPHALTTAHKLVTAANESAKLHTLSASDQVILNQFTTDFLTVVSDDLNLQQKLRELRVVTRRNRQNWLRHDLIEVRTRIASLEGALNSTTRAMTDMRKLPPPEKDPYAVMATAIGRIAQRLDTLTRSF